MLIYIIQKKSQSRTGKMFLFLVRLGYRDHRMQEAIDLVLSNGRWILENTYNGRFQVNIERKGKPSKWITLNALRILELVENT